MKNLYTTIVFISLALTSFAQYGEFPNGGFENWTDQALYDYPTDWENSNIDDYQGTPTVIQSSDAQEGSHSCELAAALTASQDTAFGYVYHGTLGQTGPADGIPYNINFDEMQFQYKCDLLNDDTLFVLAGRFIAGVLVSLEVVDAAVGTQNAWTAGSISFPSGAQDELFIAFVLGRPGGPEPTPGSWARIDNVTMHNAGIEVTNIPDPSFENWTALSTEEPDDWYTINSLLTPFNLENAVKTTDANSGSFAIEMTTIQPFGQDTIPAFLSFGAIDLGAANPFEAAPYEAVPDSIGGAFKYAPSGADQAFMTLIFYQGGSIIGTLNHEFTATSTWDTFALPITMIGTPDSLALIAFSGDNPGSVLHLDDLSFWGGNVSLDEFSSLDVEIYPNPASSSVMIQAEGTYSYSIIDLSGNVLLTEHDLNGPVEADISDLSSGAYFVTISNNTKRESHKLIVQ